jgi:hypothetical protein
MARRSISQQTFKGSIMNDKFTEAQPPVVYCDTIQAAGLHNGNVRLLLTRFDAGGKSIPALELILPQSEVKTLMAALQKISK